MHCLSSNNNFTLKLFDAFIMLGCSGTLRLQILNDIVKKDKIVLDLGEFWQFFFIFKDISNYVKMDVDDKKKFSLFSLY